MFLFNGASTFEKLKKLWVKKLKFLTPNEYLLLNLSNEKVVPCEIQSNFCFMVKYC